MTRQRIMLVEVQPTILGTRTQAALSATDADPALVITGNTATGAKLMPWAGVRSDTPLGGGTTYFETTATFLSGDDVRVGIATGKFALDGELGADVLGNSSSGPDTQGICLWRNTVAYDDGAGYASGTTIRHLVNADAGTYQIAIGAGAWHQVTANPSGSRRVWYPIISILGQASCDINLGASAFDYDVPLGAMAGIYSRTASALTAVYLASHPYGTTASETPPSQLYYARLAADADLVISADAGAWIWGSNSRSARGALSVLNGDRRYDAWLRWQWRDAKYTVFDGYLGDARATFRTYARGVCSRLNRDGDNRLLLTLADPLDVLDRPFQPNLYTASANPQLLDKAKPVTIGAPVYVPGVLRSTAQTGPEAFSYDVHDDTVASIDAAYDKGSLFLPPPTDWSQVANGTGIKLVNKPDGKISICPRGATVASGATFFDNHFASLAGWSNESFGGGTVTIVAGGARFQAGPGQQAILRRAGLFAAATGLMRIDVEIDDFSSGELVVRVDPSGAVLRQVASKAAIAVIVDVKTEDDLLIFSGPSADFTVARVLITPVRLIETLPDVIRYIAVTKGGMAEDDVDWDSIDALHAAAPYRVAAYIDNNPTTLSMLRALMDSWCGFVVPNRQGQLRVGRVGSPGNRSSVRLSKAANVVKVNQRFDVATGLTTRLAGRRNYNVHSDGDIATGVPEPLRAELQAEYTLVRSSSQSVANVLTRAHGRLSSAYQHAEAADPQATWLQDADDIQSEINRVGTFTADERDHYLYDVECLLNADESDLIDFGMDVFLQWPSYGLNEGRWLTVVSMSTRFFSRTVNLVLAPFDISNEA